MALNVSPVLTDRRKAHERRRRRLIDALLENARYFELARFRATVAGLAFGSSTLLHICAPMMLAMRPANFVQASVIWGVLAPCVGLFSMVMAYCAARRVELIGAATTELQHRQKLPKLP